MKKHLVLSVAIYFLALAAGAQSTDSAYQKILQLSKKVWNIHDTEISYAAKKDSLARWNGALIQHLESYAARTPAFLEKTYQDWQDNRLYMITAEDKKFRIVYWDEGWDGSIRQYCAVAFWQSGSQVKSQSLTEEIQPNYYLSSVHHFHRQNGGDVYILIGSSGDRFAQSGFVKAFCVENNGKLDTGARIFKTATKQLNEITADVNLANYQVQSDEDLIHFGKNSDSNNLYIPLTSNKPKEPGEQLPLRYLTYQFDGNYFVYRKK